MLWILFSDSMLSWVARDSIFWQISHIHILKGVFFIGITGAALFYFVHSLYQRLLAREKDVELLYLNNPHPILIIHPHNLMVTHANDAARFLLGYAPGELHGKDFLEMIGRNNRDHFRTLFLKSSMIVNFRSAGNWPVETNTGKILMIQMDVSYISGTQPRYMIALHNLTSQLRAERELKEIGQFIERKIAERTVHLERQNEELVFRARETEKVNSELIFINQRLQDISREKSLRDDPAMPSRARNPEALN